jgi:hypothetical protein
MVQEGGSDSGSAVVPTAMTGISSQRVPLGFVHRAGPSMTTLESRGPRKESDGKTDDEENPEPRHVRLLLRL